MNKVMVLGAGKGQVPIIELCHQYGCHVITVSPKGNYPGLALADEICELNVRDYEAVLEAAKREGISAILTDQLDAGVLTAAYVAEKLNLKGITIDTALKFTNKAIMRHTAGEAGIFVPRSVSITDTDSLAQTLEDNGLSFPLMMKPVDSAASRGVFKVNTLDEIREQFDITKSYSKAGAVIIEQFIEGKEFVVEAFTRDYQVTNLIVGHRDYFDIPNTFIPNATVFSDADSAVSPLERRLKETNLQLVKEFGLNFGITHAEYLYNEKEDRIYLVEIAARGGGVFISSELIFAACGINANDLLVREALGLENDKTIALKTGSSAYFCYLLPKGKITVLNGTKEAEKVQGVIKAYFDNVEIGMISKSITDKSSRKGPILVKGNSKEECYEIIESVKQQLEIKIANQGTTQNAIWG